MKKSFGQNLLISEIFLEKIIKSVDLNSEDIVLEIGSGSGLLTCLLAKYVKKIFAVEPEKNILKSLKYNINLNKLTNVEILEKSFLKLDLCEFSKKERLKIIGNIPYNLTSKILLKLFGELDAPSSHLEKLKDVYLMLQLEVAERLIAKPGTKAYSPLTLLIQYFSEPEILFKVPSSAFLPVPKVESAFVHFSVKSKVQKIDNPDLLKKSEKLYELPIKNKFKFT
jgi:16S rRNA (adenine1518-N6/adenine1519-N6)-dimethyltransferase